MFLGAPLALAARPLGRPWLFYVGLLLVAVALVLPAVSGQTPRQRLAALLSHLPGVRWLRRRG